ARPTSAARRPTPPSPGMKPMDSSGKPNRARVPQTRRWQASAISSPPPRQSPFTAAMNGFGMPKRASSSARPARAWLSASPGDGRSAIAPRPPPTENTRRTPVTTTTRTALAATIDRVSASSAKSAGVRALTGGLSSRTTAVLPSTTVSTSFLVSAIGSTHALQEGARGLVAIAEARLQRCQPGLQEGRVERPDLLERALVRADARAQDGVDLLALAQSLGETPEVLVDEPQPDALGDVVPRTGRRCGVRLCEQGEQARVRAPAAVPVQKDAALAFPSQVTFRAHGAQAPAHHAVLGDQGRPLPVEDVQRHVDADEIERCQRAQQHPRIRQLPVDGGRGGGTLGADR